MAFKCALVGEEVERAQQCEAFVRSVAWLRLPNGQLAEYVIVPKSELYKLRYLVKDDHTEPYAGVC